MGFSIPLHSEAYSYIVERIRVWKTKRRERQEVTIDMTQGEKTCQNETVNTKTKILTSTIKDVSVQLHEEDFVASPSAMYSVQYCKLRT